MFKLNKLEKIANDILENLNYKDVRYMVSLEVLTDEGWLEIDRIADNEEKELTAMIICKLEKELKHTVEVDDENGIINDLKVDTVRQMIEDSVEEKLNEKISSYINEKLNFNYMGKGIYNITRGEYFFEVKFSPGNIKKKNILSIYSNNENNLFLNYAENEIFQKELDIYIGKYFIMAFLNGFIFEKYKETKEYKLNNMYN
jgi:hypothetical protein